MGSVLGAIDGDSVAAMVGLAVGAVLGTIDGVRVSAIVVLAVGSMLGASEPATVPDMMTIAQHARRDLNMVKILEVIYGKSCRMMFFPR